jgi:DTW domain-containing protein YfiP
LTHIAQALPRGFRQPRCAGCALSAALCICRLWPPLEAAIDISIVMPKSEARSASNTARLLALWLPRAELGVCGDRDSEVRPAALVERPQSAILFPGANHDEALPGSVQHLIVPDGTWSQARRIERRWFAPYALPRVHLADGWPSAYQLRRGGTGLCTFEATAVALGLLADVSLAQTLLRRFAEWARRAHWLKLGGHPPQTLSTCGVHGEATHPAAIHLAESAPRAIVRGQGSRRSPPDPGPL